MAEVRSLTPEEKAVLEALSDDIDLTDPDAPEVRDWSGAVRGALYRPCRGKGGCVSSG
jgi:hypothetical protein